MTPKPTASQVAQQALDRANQAVQIHEETNRMVKDIHQALMTPHDGYGNRALIKCVSELVIEAQSGKLVGAKLIWYGKILTALASISAAAYAVLQWGQAPK
jgi:hypothetical protein